MRESPRIKSASAPSSGARSANAALRLEIAGETVELLAERAAWWPVRRTLIVADLHLGKEETFQHYGVPIPRGVIDDSLRRLTTLTRMHDAERVIVVGDLVHARHGLTHDVIERVAAWRSTFAGSFELALGNHDRGIELPASWGVVIRVERRDGPFSFVHDPEDADVDRREDRSYSWCGHLHPTVRLAGAIDQLTLPCFLIGSRRAVLPAFTAFARGPGVVPTFGERIFALAEGEIVEIAAS